jgi:hypothetical protein
MAKIVVLKAGSEKKMPDELKKLVNEAFEGAEEEEEKELEGIINEDIRKAREMINEIEELLMSIDGEELSKPNQDYVSSLIMHLGEFTPEEKEEGEDKENEE